MSIMKNIQTNKIKKTAAKIPAVNNPAKHLHSPYGSILAEPCVLKVEFAAWLAEGVVIVGDIDGVKIY
jgi:hypothetical protein